MMGMHSKTPRLSVTDSRGLAIRAVEYWRAETARPAEPRITRTVLDAAGRAVRQWDPRLWALQMTDPLAPANLTTVYSLNDNVLRSDSVDAGMQIELLGLGGQVLCGWDGRGTSREVAYDLLLRPVALFETGATQPRQCVERLTYGQPDSGDPALNQFGQLIRHDDPAGSELFDEFALGGQCTAGTRRFLRALVDPDWPEPFEEREVLLEPGAGATTRWRFSALQSLLEQVDARGNRQTFELTLHGRLRMACLQLENQTAAQTLVSEIRYNAADQVEHELAGNGVRTTLAYRPQDNRLRLRHSEKADATILQRLLYDYDPMGNVLSIEDQALPVRYFANQRIEPISRFSYDSLNQLSEARGWEAGAAEGGPTAIANYSQSYRYDAGGNLLKLIHVGAQNPGHDLQAARYSNRCLPWRNGVPPDEAQIALAFDTRGNLLELEPGRRLMWNLRDQLHSVTPVQRASGLHDQEVYVCDGNARRVRKLRSLQTNARTVVAEVRYLPGLELRSDSGTGEQLQIITVQTGLNRVRVLHWQSAPPAGINDQYRYSFTDHLRSVGLELAADGGIVSREHFYPFGETAWCEEGETRYKNIRYSGKERDATGLYDFGHRYYIPWLQRWLNPDPAGAIDGHNRYRAMRNSPVVYRDSDGRKPEKKLDDRVYHILAEKKLVNPIQAAGMQPVRNYFESNPDPKVQDYRRQIPVELAKLGAKSGALLNTHEAHVRAAVITETSPPSGPVMYHGGEVLSAGLSTVLGEKVASRVMGPMSDVFNSPVEDPKVLEARRDAVAWSIKTGGQLLMHASHPAAQIVGAVGVAMGTVMRTSEAQTRVQYKLLSAPVNVPVSAAANTPRMSFQPFLQTPASVQRSLFTEQSAAPSSFVQQAFHAGFVQAPTQVAQASDYLETEDPELNWSRRG